MKQLLMRSILALLLLNSGAHAETLLELYHQALDTNPALLGKQYLLEKTSAQEDQAFSRLLPQISVTGTYSLNRFNSAGVGTRDYEGLRGSIQARQPLFDLASYLKYQGAKAATQQRESELAAYRMQLAGEVLDRYLLVLEANDHITYLTSEKEATGSEMKRLRKMYQQQMAKITDVYEVEAYYQTLETRALEADNAKAIALEKLRETTGVTLQQVFPLGETQFPSVPDTPEQWVEKALRSNPNLMALKFAIESAEQQIASAKAEHLPQLSLVLYETYSDQGYDNRQFPPYDVSSINLQLTIPIYEGGRVVAYTKETVAQYFMQKQQYEQVRRQIEREIRTAYLNTASSYARIDSTAKEVLAQEKASVAHQKGYGLGVTTIVDVLNTRRRLFKARTDRLQAHYDYIRSLIALHIWSGDMPIDLMEKIDGWFSEYQRLVSPA